MVTKSQIGCRETERRQVTKHPQRDSTRRQHTNEIDCNESTTHLKQAQRHTKRPPRDKHIYTGTQR